MAALKANRRSRQRSMDGGRRFSRCRTGCPATATGSHTASTVRIARTSFGSSRLPMGRRQRFHSARSRCFPPTRDARPTGVRIAGAAKTGDGVQLLDPQSGRLRVLDASPETYTGLAWRKDAEDLAVLRSKSEDRHDAATHVTLAWTQLGDASERRHVY